MKVERNCDICGKLYTPDPRNLKRGWGLCCSKVCSANNERRKNWGFVRAIIVMTTKALRHFARRVN